MIDEARSDLEKLDELMVKKREIIALAKLELQNEKQEKISNQSELQTSNQPAKSEKELMIQDTKNLVESESRFITHLGPTHLATDKYNYKFGDKIIISGILNDGNFCVGTDFEYE